VCAYVSGCAISCCVSDSIRDLRFLLTVTNFRRHQSTASICRTMIWWSESESTQVVILLLLLTVNQRACGYQEHRGDVIPSWQTILPDTGIVIPLMSSSTQRWILSSSGVNSEDDDSSINNKYKNISATVPGDIISDLLNAGLLENGDPYIDRNFITQRDTWMGHDAEEGHDDNASSSSTTATTTTRTTPKWKTWSKMWEYTTMFDFPPIHDDEKDADDDGHIQWKLVLEGIKMGARVVFNGVEMGIAKDQFLRYEFWLSSSEEGEDVISNKRHKYKHKQNNLTIVFDPTINVDGRFTACSGGWDWAPYVRAKDNQGTQMYTFGIVKPIYVIGVRQFSISHVVPKTYYIGDYPIRPMRNNHRHPDSDFQLDIDVHFEHSPPSHPSIRQQQNNSNQTIPPPVSSSLLLLIRSNFGVHEDLDIVLGPSQSHENDDDDASPDRNQSSSTSVVTYSYIVPRDKIELWWPNGMGEQPLYEFSIRIGNRKGDVDGNCPGDGCEGTGFKCRRKAQQMTIRKRIGFRTTALVTVNETNKRDRIKDGDPVEHNQDDAAEGSGQHGMYFRINGAIVMARGANFIPMDQLEGRLDGQAHRIAVQSAAKANMNMIRIWGGGMVPPDEFYDACDENGILLYHDMMFVDEEGHRPVQTEIVEQEIRHLVRSLAFHPSIVVWNGCNECAVVMGEPSEIYATFVMRTVAQEDDSRSVWPSSPSRHGWATGVRTEDGRPFLNGKNLTTYDPKAFHANLESHGPYMRSFSYTFPSVNGEYVGL
jgi:hypothetical protein